MEGLRWERISYAEFFCQLEQSQDAALCWISTTRMSMQEPYGVARSLLRWHWQGELSRDRLEAMLAAQGETSLLADEVRCRLLHQTLH
mgnify:CR=1 FL=1